MKIEEFRQKLTSKGWAISEKEEITADEKSGVKHIRLPLHKVAEDGGLIFRKVGYWHDTTGHLGTAGEVYPDYENGDLPRVLPLPAVPDALIECVTTAVKAQPGVLAVRSMEKVDNCVIVRVLIVESGTVRMKAYTVYEKDAKINIVPYIEI